MFAPENGNMLGGVMVNLTGPCFEPGTRVTCRFEPETVSVSSHMGNEERCPHQNVILVVSACFSNGPFGYIRLDIDFEGSVRISLNPINCFAVRKTDICPALGLIPAILMVLLLMKTEHHASCQPLQKQKGGWISRFRLTEDLIIGRECSMLVKIIDEEK